MHDRARSHDQRPDPKRVSVFFLLTVYFHVTVVAVVYLLRCCSDPDVWFILHSSFFSMSFVYTYFIYNSQRIRCSDVLSAIENDTLIRTRGVAVWYTCCHQVSRQIAETIREAPAGRRVLQRSEWLTHFTGDRRTNERTNRWTTSSRKASAFASVVLTIVLYLSHIEFFFIHL